MDYYTAISTVVSNNSQFLLLLTILYCVLKIVHLEKEVKYLRYDYVCLKEMVLEETDEDEENEETNEDTTDEDDNDRENENETKEELKDENYEPEEDSSSEE